MFSRGNTCHVLDIYWMTWRVENMSRDITAKGDWMILGTMEYLRILEASLLPCLKMIVTTLPPSKRFSLNSIVVHPHIDKRWFWGFLQKVFFFVLMQPQMTIHQAKNAEARLCKPKTKTILAKRFIRCVEFLVKHTNSMYLVYNFLAGREHAGRLDWDENILIAGLQSCFTWGRQGGRMTHDIQTGLVYIEHPHLGQKHLSQ